MGANLTNAAGPGKAEPIEVAPDVRRLTCPNPSPMTYRGTETYLIGRDAVTIIDPGPDHAGHRAAILAALAGRPVERIVVTHTHVDHSGGAPALARATGSPTLAFGAQGAGMSETMRALAAEGLVGGGEGADPGFRPDGLLADGETVDVGGRPLTALWTPGHLSNHLSLVWGDLVFTGDTVMGWSSTLISPPDGDLGQFLTSLDRLEGLGARRFLPGHGDPVEAPGEAVLELRAHRLARAEQVRAALSAAPGSAPDLARRIYVDVDPRLLPAAARNVLATLIWLAEQGEARTEGPVGATAVFAPA